MDPPACPCHGVVMQWDKDRRWPQGGFWRCVKKAQAAQRAYYERKMNDSVWRNERRLKQARRNRAVTLAKRAPAHPGMAALLASTRRS